MGGGSCDSGGGVSGCSGGSCGSGSNRPSGGSGGLSVCTAEEKNSSLFRLVKNPDAIVSERSVEQSFKKFFSSFVNLFGPSINRMCRSLGLESAYLFVYSVDEAFLVRLMKQTDAIGSERSVEQSLISSLGRSCTRLIVRSVELLPVELYERLFVCTFGRLIIFINFLNRSFN